MEAKKITSAERGNAVTARLQRGILRLALTYTGRSDVLDQKLKEFGSLLRSGQRQDQRQQLIDDIVDTIVGLDLKPSAETAAAHQDFAEPVAHFFEHVSLPPNLKPEVEQLQRSLAAAKDRQHSLELIAKSANLLSRYFLSSPESVRDALTVRVLMQELVDRLPIPSNQLGAVKTVRKNIEAAQTIDAFMDCNREICLIVERLRADLQRELDQLSTYLSEVANRLQDFENLVTRSGDIQQSSSADTVQLSETVIGQISAIRDEAHTATNIETLRTRIDEHLNTINEELDGFVNSQQSRQQASDQVIKSMAGKLMQLEEQTQSLRNDLAKQQAQAMIDPLTGVLSRAGYLETSTQEFERWKRYGNPLSLAVIDLDFFKRINDEYGHSAGDRVLSTVAAKIQEHTRKNDILCRYGGEEFVLILPETDAPKAYDLLDKLRDAIEHCAFRYKDTPVRVSISAGVAEFRDGDEIEDVFGRADQAMYQAKRNGRNQVCGEDELDAAAAAARFDFKNAAES